MADDNSKQQVVIKRVKKVYHKHHGGSWKIAYADFVTGMMAFFLLMWLLSMLNKYQLEGIAKYFQTPLKEAFNKQANVSRTHVYKPDKLGPTTFEETGSKEKTLNSQERNLGTQKTVNKQADKIQSPSQTQENPIQNKNLIMSGQQEQMKKMQVMKAELEEKLQKDPEISQFKNSLNFIVTSDGLKIVLHDLENKPMFSTGKTDFEQYAKTILSWLSQQINSYNNKLMIIGHTDSVPYASGDANYGNWELSADRASATRRVLIKSGMDPSKILRVVGGADTDLLNQKNGVDPANRRIEIIILTDQAAKQIQNQ